MTEKTAQSDEAKSQAAKALVRLMERLEHEGGNGTVSVRVPRNRGKWGKVRGGVEEELKG